jgi:hypothetical protein
MAVRFRRALRRLRGDPAEATRIDALVTRAGDDQAMVSPVTRVAMAGPGDSDPNREEGEQHGRRPGR